MERGMFRRAALERMSTPDRLDELIEVTTPHGWLGLVALVGMLVAVAAWAVYGRVPAVVRGEGMLIREGSLQTLDATVAGKVDALFVKLGDDVQPDQPVARIVAPADRGATLLTSADAGRVVELRATPGSPVAVGTPIVRLERAGGTLEAVLYLAPPDAARVRPGMEVQVSPASVRKEEYGVLLGRVSAVGTFPASRDGMERVLGSADVAGTLAAAGPRIEVRVQPTRSPATASGYQWTSTLGTVDAAARDALPAPLASILPARARAAGPPSAPANGTLCSADIVTEQQAPIHLVLAPFER
jgi:pyruvate/2-oxoglutarate dehydrogenase complex dihydrolipoamide acyltransferase (E2) component